MLLDRYRELLTAYVDGELSNRQRRHVARLLHRSPEARRLFEQLQQDARALRHLPRPRLAADLTGHVLHTIRERRLSPGQRRVAKASAASAWMGPLASYAAAAAVLLILGAASYLYFAASLVQPEKLELAQTQTKIPAPSLRPLPADSPRAKEEKPQTASAAHEPPHTKNDSPAAVKPPLVVKKDQDKPTLPHVAENVSAPPKDESALTDRMEMFQLDRVPDTLPVVVIVSDLDREARRKDLLAELGKDGDCRIELPCKHGSKAFDRVQQAARTIHLGLIVEKQAQERIKQKWRTNYVLYIENLTPEELTRFVQQIGIEDRKSSAGKPAEAQIDRLVLTRMTPQQRKELSTLLGIDPTTTAPSANGPLGTDLRKPLSDLTAQQLSRALAGQGGSPRPEAGKVTVKPPDHFALVLAYNPVRPAPGSEEIKRFLESRKPARPGTIRVLLVLRG